MTGTDDNDFELPPEEAGDGSGTLGPGDGTVKFNLFGEATDSDGYPSLSCTLGPNDVTVNTGLAELAGASTDAIQLPEGRFALGSKLGQGGMGAVSYTHLTLPTKRIV